MLNTASNPTVDIADPVKEVVPTRGAVVKAKFVARSGQRVLLTLTNRNQFVPFGATVTLEDASEANYASIVGEQGQVYLTGIKNGDRILAKWGNDDKRKCRADIIIPASNTAKNIVEILTSACR